MEILLYALASIGVITVARFIRNLFPRDLYIGEKRIPHSVMWGFAQEIKKELGSEYSQHEFNRCMHEKIHKYIKESL